VVSLSRLEIKDILENTGPGLDPELLAKLRAGANAVSLMGGTSVQNAPDTLKFPPGVRTVGLATTHVLEHPEGTGRAVLTPKLEAKGFTQEDIDAINAAADAAREAQESLKANYKPIVGEKNANNINAAFAEPDIPPAPVQPPVVPGQKNIYGDTCAKFDHAGQPVYACQRGHGYLLNRSVPGCPTCFMQGGIAAPTHDDPYAIDGEETF
jgi:hypothetical protein